MRDNRPVSARSEERAARNETMFRDANERIAERRAELNAVEGRTPFLCECEDEACSELVRLTAAEYERVRAEPEQFVIVAGHPTDGDETVMRGEDWVCVRKGGVGGEIARATNPRG